MTSILVADNDPYWLKNLSNTVQNGGFGVISASTPKEAMAVLGKHAADIAVLDLRLEEDTDPFDLSGLSVAEDTDRMVPKIIVSDFGSITEAAESLKIDIEGFPSIVDFVEKKSISTRLVPSIERAIKVRQTWSATAHTKVSSQLDDDYRIARKDAKWHYLVSLIISVGFALLIFYGAFHLHTDGSLSVLFAVLGVLVAEATNYFFGKKLKFLYDRVEKFHSELLQTNRFQQLLESSYLIKDERAREQIKIALFNAAIGQWLHKVDVELVSPESKATNLEPQRNAPTGT